MKKIGKILLVVLLIILLKLLFTFTINQIVIQDYYNQKMDKELIHILKKTNINEPYIVYYNEGNIYFQEKNYKKALQSYEKAIEKNPPIKRKCDIRINMSITLLENIKTTKKDELLKKLQEARENLYLDHCADEEDNSGESEEAESLEEEIKQLEKELEENNNSQESSKNNEEEETEEEKSIKKELQEINKDANASRQSDLQEYENLGNYQYYSGRNW